MAIITREDGTQFSINNYFETVIFKRSFTLKKELQTLANIHGKFARFYYKDENKTAIQAVFSSEQAYLLSICVWKHFGSRENPNLIYCEALKGDKALLVIIHERTVYLSTELEKTAIPHELASLLLLSEHTKYNIYLYGDLPISDTPAEGKFCFDKTMVGQLQQLKEAVFPKLETPEDCYLLPVPEAIKLLHLPGNPTIPVLIVVGIIVIFGYLWKKAHPRKLQQLQTQITTNYLNPTVEIQNRLHTPIPRLILLALADQIDLCLSAPAWQCTQATYLKPNTIGLTTLPIGEGASFYDLVRWGTRHHYTVQPNSTGASLFLTLQLPLRNIDNIYDSALNTYSLLQDGFQSMAPYSIFQFKSSKKNPAYQEFKVALSLQKASTTQLRQVANHFHKEPIVIDAMSFSIHEGLLSGTIDFSILGI